MIASLLAASWLTAGCAAPLTQEPGEIRIRPALVNGFYVTRDGFELPLREWLPKGGRPPKRIIIALHGLNDHSSAFEAIGAYLSEHHDIGVLSYDQRGFGGSPWRGVWPGHVSLIEDLRDIISLVRDRYHDAEVILLGESMGGAIVLATLAEHPELGLHRAILVAPAVWGWNGLWFFQRFLLWAAAHSFPDSILTGKGLDIQASDNLEVLRKLYEDPLVIKGTRVDVVFGLVELMQRALNGAERIKNPGLLILYGMRDEIVPKGPIRELLAVFDDEGRHHAILYPEGWHMLLRDLQAEKVWRDIAGWIEGAHSIGGGGNAAPRPDDSRLRLPSEARQALQ